MHSCYSKSYFREVQTFQPGIPRGKETGSRQTVRQQAGASQSPIARPKIRGGCWPLLDGGGKQNRVSSVLELEHIEASWKWCERLRPAFRGERTQAVGKLLERKPEGHSCLSRDKTTVQFIDTIAEMQILSYLPPEEIWLFGTGCLGAEVFQFMKYQCRKVLIDNTCCLLMQHLCIIVKFSENHFFPLLKWNFCNISSVCMHVFENRNDFLIASFPLAWALMMRYSRSVSTSTYRKSAVRFRLPYLCWSKYVMFMSSIFVFV